jgi:endonuclease III
MYAPLFRRLFVQPWSITDVLMQSIINTHHLEGEGFEPSKAEPSDLQSDPFDRSGTPPQNQAGHFDPTNRQCQLLSGKMVSMDREKCRAIFERFQALNPQPRTELQFSNAFELLIAVILSAQATDVSVNKATPALFAVANTPEKIAALGEAGLKSYIKSIGLYNTKAKNIIQTCRLLIEHHGSQTPSDRESLESLPGVGRKTANVILNTAFGESTVAVDTHIFRVARRIGLAPSEAKTPRQVELALEKEIPPQYLRDAHHWLVLHGRYICTARKPKCPQCPIRDLCEYPYKTLEIDA